MSSIYQCAQFVISGIPVVGKTGLGPQKIMDPVTMIAAMVKLQVLQNWAEPDSTGAKCFDIAKLILYAGEFATLKVEELRIIERLMNGARFRVIEAINYNEIDRLVSPVDRGRMDRVQWQSCSRQCRADTRCRRARRSRAEVRRTAPRA